MKQTNSNSSQTRQTLFTARQLRLLKLLRRGVWVSRENVDRVAGASNGPQIVAELRKKLVCYECIEMRRVDRIDRDGKPCRPGQYRLTNDGKQRAAKMLDGGDDE